MEEQIEVLLADLREEIEGTKGRVAKLPTHGFFQDENGTLARTNIPTDRHQNMLDNITLVFRHLEDARMRIGKVLQAHQGGISILDK